MKYIRQSHQWDTVEVLCVRCPHCKKFTEDHVGVFMEGDIIHCGECHKDFKLGARK